MTRTINHLYTPPCREHTVPCSSPPPETTHHSIPSICGLVANRSPQLLKYSLEEVFLKNTLPPKIAFYNLMCFPSLFRPSCFLFQNACHFYDSFVFNISRQILFSLSSTRRKCISRMCNIGIALNLREEPSHSVHHTPSPCLCRSRLPCDPTTAVAWACAVSTRLSRQMRRPC
jgi:hypothetical protein